MRIHDHVVSHGFFRAGVCNMDPTKGLFRRRPSNASTHSRLRAQSSNANASSSSLSVSSAAAQSCPTSPKNSPLPIVRRSVGNERIPEDEIVLEQPPTTSREAAEYAAAFEDARREQEQRQLQQQQQLSRSQRSPRPVNSSREAPRVSSAGSRRESAARREMAPHSCNGVPARSAVSECVHGVVRLDCTLTRVSEVLKLVVNDEAVKKYVCCICFV